MIESEYHPDASASGEGKTTKTCKTLSERIKPCCF